MPEDEHCEEPDAEKPHVRICEGHTQQWVCLLDPLGDEATDNLKSLLDKKKALQTEELMHAVMKSNRSYEEILRFIQSAPSEEDKE